MSTLSRRPQFYEIEVVAAGSAVAWAPPEDATKIELLSKADTIYFSDQGTVGAALSEPYAELASGDSWESSDVQNFGVAWSTFYFDADAGANKKVVAIVS